MGYVFGKTIYELRKAKGLTLEELANEIDSSKGYLSGIETSTRRPPSDEIVCRLARILGTNRKMLLRLAHIDKVPEDIKQELRYSTIITPPKVIQKTGQDLATLLRESTPGCKKREQAPFPVGHIPILNNEGESLPSGFSNIDDLWKNTREFIQFKVPGIQVAFALRMPDESMERKRGISFEENSLVFFSPTKKTIQNGDNFFVVYRSEKGLCSIFRSLKHYNRRRIHLITLNSRYRKEIILQRRMIEKLWKAVVHLREIS